jgi:hypothetical protein
MADIVLTGNTSGAITVAAPAVAGTNTLTLPASTSTIATTADVNSLTTGKILQIVQATQATNVETTSTSYITTGLTADITVSADNKVLVLGVLNAVGVNATLTGVKVGLFRASTEITTPSLYAGYNTSSTNHTQIVPLDFLDSSPATGSNTYTVYFHKQGSGTARVMVDNAMSRIILCEVAA